ncbi:MAG: hypothetical protein ACK5IC_03110 [Moheibacter sp.]
MKKIILFLLVTVNLFVYAQVGIDTDTPKASLDIMGKPTNISTLDGVIAPHIAGEQLRTKIYTTDQVGAIVYVTTADTTPIGQTINVKSTGYYFFDGTLWKRIDNNPWKVEGNAGATVSTNFLGTTDAQNLIFKVNNVQSGLIDGFGGKYNTSFGYNSLNSTTTGKFNSAFGTSENSGVLLNNTTGSYNQAFGIGTMASNTTGKWNVAFGYGSLILNTGGSGNTAIGHLSMVNNLSGVDNTAIGTNSLNRNATGSGNIALGKGASMYSTTGKNNIAIGLYAAAISENNYLNTGSYNILIGNAAMPVNPNGDYQLNIGNIIYGKDVLLPTAKIGIGTDNPISTFEVNGTITNAKSFNAGNTSTINFDFGKSNFVRCEVPIGNITINGIKDGGTYTLAVKNNNSTSGTASFTVPGFTVKVANNNSVAAGAETIYLINIIGATAYISMEFLS